MNVFHVKWDQTNLLSKLVDNYVLGNSETTSFYHTTPTLESIKQYADSRKFAINQRIQLVNALATQYKQAGIEIPCNLALLSQENTFTITTGHQLCLFGGPAYFIYKIASTIKLANQLKEKYPEMNFIPVFWMATEDHDVDEIDHAELHGQKIVAAYQNPYISGRLKSAEALHALEQFASGLGLSNSASQLADVFRKSFKRTTLSHATRAWVHALFAKYNLLIIDGDDVALKQHFIPVFEKEINDQITAITVGATNERLKNSGYKTQVNPRDLNLFYLEGGNRSRLLLDKLNHLQTESGKIVTIHELCNSPEVISPNVLLRPLYQEILLPNLAYVGGGGEIAYWLQLRELFEQFSMKMPALILRDSFVWLPAAAKRWQQSTGLLDEELFMDEEQQKKLILERAGYVQHQFEAEKTTLQVALDMVAQKINPLNPSLEFSVKALKTDTLNRFKVLEDKIWREAKKRENEKLSALQKLRTSLFPNGSLAERSESAFNHLAKFETIDAFLTFLIASANPTESGISLIQQE